MHITHSHFIVGLPFFYLMLRVMHMQATSPSHTFSCTYKYTRNLQTKASNPQTTKHLPNLEIKTAITLLSSAKFPKEQHEQLPGAVGTHM
jgi:hypothetical protein